MRTGAWEQGVSSGTFLELRRDSSDVRTAVLSAKGNGGDDGSLVTVGPWL